MEHLQTVGFSGLYSLVVIDADGGELRDDDLLPEGGLTEDGEGPDIVMAWRPSRTQVHSSYCTPRPPVPLKHRVTAVLCAHRQLRVAQDLSGKS